MTPRAAALARLVKRNRSTEATVRPRVTALLDIRRNPLVSGPGPMGSGWARPWIMSAADRCNRHALALGFVA